MRRASCRTVRMHSRDKKANAGQRDSDLADMINKTAGLAKPYRMKMQLCLDPLDYIYELE